MKPRIGVVHGNLNLPGGSEAVCFHAIEALKGDYQVDLITDRTVNVRRVNQLFGTNLAAGDFSVRVSGWPYLLDRLAPGSRLIKWKRALLQKSARRAGRRYGLLFSTCDEADFGGRGLQYIHFPRQADEAGMRKTGEISVDRLQGGSFALKAYYRLYRRWFAPDYEQIKKNRTICNSGFTGNVFEKFYGVKSEVVYPPVVNLAAYALPWPERDDGFVCAGRIAPEKNVLRSIRIIKNLREKGLDLHLHIVGQARDRGYSREVMAECRGFKFLFYEGEVGRPELNKLMGSHRYFIHGYDFEHFGMAAAEAVSAGCIPFVPGTGGQVEVVGGNPALCYSGEADAAEKIAGVCRSGRVQDDIREKLKALSPQFSAGIFEARIREAVREELKRPGAAGHENRD